MRTLRGKFLASPRLPSIDTDIFGEGRSPPPRDFSERKKMSIIFYRRRFNGVVHRHYRNGFVKAGRLRSIVPLEILLQSKHIQIVNQVK